MNVRTIGLPERSWASAGYAAEYARGVRLYAKVGTWRMTFLEAPLLAGATVNFPIFLFPRPVHVTRLIGITRSASPLDQASLEFGISDVSDRPRDKPGAGHMVTDGRFNRTAPVLGLTGRQFGWFLLDRWQPFNSKWQWTLTNTGSVTLFPVFMLDVQSATQEECQAVFT